MITPYKEQRRLISRELAHRFGSNILQSIVEVSTVDGYQGQEKEIIIFSCVRTGDKCKKLNYPIILLLKFNYSVFLCSWNRFFERFSSFKCRNYSCKVLPFLVGKGFKFDSKSALASFNRGRHET